MTGKKLEHHFDLSLSWTGNIYKKGTSAYDSYERSFVVNKEGKLSVYGSSDEKFRGDPERWNPEEMLLSSISSCHMLWFLHLCSDEKIVVKTYEDTPEMVLTFESKDQNSSGKITLVTLNPTITLEGKVSKEKIEKIHEASHQKCFIANSVNFKVIVNLAFQK